MVSGHVGGGDGTKYRFFSSARRCLSRGEGSMSDAIVFDVVREALAEGKPVGPGHLPQAGRETDAGKMRGDGEEINRQDEAEPGHAL